MLKVLLSGCFGKMCRNVENVIESNDNVEVVAGIDMCRDMTADFPTFANYDDVNVIPDVIIDFSHPSNLDDILGFAVKNKTAVVIATTGYSDGQIAKIKATAKLIPIFFTFNMSLGVNLLISLARTATNVLGKEFDIEIIERHHNQKIDAPSGTALMIADAINEENENRMEFDFDRHSKREKRSKNEIGIHSVRGGTIVGEHEILFAGNDEMISLTHTALSKNVFAVGAVRAAEFIAGRPAGLYDMNSLINK